MTRGVDIYRYQTVTDYQALARAVRFVYVKLTDGKGPAVVRGDKQVNGCIAAEIPVGGYHYAQPGDPRAQAQVFVAELRRLRALNLAPVLDLESPFSPDAVARDFGIKFCHEVARAGYRPGVYMSASWAGTLRPDRWGIPGLVIWVAAYGANDAGAYHPETDPATVRRYYSGRYDVHQHTSTATVAGIRGQVDLNWALTGVPRNSTSTKEEPDMKLTDAWDEDKLTDLGPTKLGHALLKTKQDAAAARAFAQQALAATLADKDVDVETLAAAVVAKQRDLLEEVIREVVPDEVAEDVVRKLGEKLQPTE